MSVVHRARAGWWHNYVCPTHGTELLPARGDTFPCGHGCEFHGEPFAAAWTVFEHQAAARRARLLAHRAGSGDREEAITIVAEFADYYREVSAEGWSGQSESWMLRGKLFSQALTEAIWAVQLADAVIQLAQDDTARAALGDDVTTMLTGLLDTLETARRVLVVEQANPTSNYVAWIDAAGGLLGRALLALGQDAGPTDVATWVSRTIEHSHLAVAADGWEWEGSTYYHLFVIRAYLLNLAGTDPTALAAADADTFARMLRVLAALAAPDGRLPMLHDGPYDRAGVHLEVLETCVLARQFWQHTGLDRVEDWARGRLGDTFDGLEDLLANWYAGPPRASAASGSGTRGSVLFANAGFAVLRDSADTFQAVLDAGPHGGSHGHLDKLGLYLYGAGAAWQPAPGVPPYGSALRKDYYARTVAHPTVTVDGADQLPGTGEIELWDDAGTGSDGSLERRVVATANTVIDGATLRRELVMTDRYLLDIVDVVITSGETREIALALRPAVPMTVTARDGGWQSVWSAGSGAVLHGLHRASVPSALVSRPGRGPSDAPAHSVQLGDWTATAPAVTYVSVYSPGDTPAVTAIELATEGVELTGIHLLLADGSRTTRQVRA